MEQRRNVLSNYLRTRIRIANTSSNSFEDLRQHGNTSGWNLRTIRKHWRNMLNLIGIQRQSTIEEMGSIIRITQWVYLIDIIKECFNWSNRQCRTLEVFVTSDLANEVFSKLVYLNEYLRDFGLEPQLSITAAVGVLKKLNVNIFDFVKHRGQAKRFPTLKDLRIYSIRNKKVFPLVEAKSSGLSCFLKPLVHR